MVNKIQGFEVMGEGTPDQYITAGAGMVWDEFVAQTVERGLSGVEFLSLIPGTVGGTPVQNVGAYGQEVANSIMTIEAYDVTARQFVTLRNDDCAFGYRSSRFKTTDRGRFFITAVTFFLTQGNPQPPFYAAVEQYCKDKAISPITPQAGREAVIAIRRAKLPDPAVVANNGSFFANPIVDSEQYLQLQSLYPELSHWMIDDNHIKLSAAWLIDQAGFKDFHDPETGMATWPAQPLVLVNEQAKTTQDLLTFRQKIVDTVQQKFGVILQQEPELLP
jgi:UDP-N-acetylmuramate dehydrogenase